MDKHFIILVNIFEYSKKPLLEILISVKKNLRFLQSSQVKVPKVSYSKLHNGEGMIVESSFKPFGEHHE